jgi:tetratricopeptide (TPR) repeat protein
MKNCRWDKRTVEELYDEALKKLQEYDFSTSGRTMNPETLNAALLLFTKAKEKAPYMTNARIGLANCYLRRGFTGDIEESTKIFEKIIRENPTNSYAHLGLGRCLNVKGNLEGAISEIEIAISINPEFYTAHFDLGNLYVLKENSEKAREHLQLATKSEFSQISSRAKGIIKLMDKEDGKTEK